MTIRKPKPILAFNKNHGEGGKFASGSGGSSGGKSSAGKKSASSGPAPRKQGSAGKSSGGTATKVAKAASAVGGAVAAAGIAKLFGPSVVAKIMTGVGKAKYAANQASTAYRTSASKAAASLSSRRNALSQLGQETSNANRAAKLRAIDIARRASR